jgi:aldose 1-epimerase
MAGSELHALRIGEAPGPVLEVLARGATVARFEVTDAHGERRDLGVGYATEEEYQRRPHYLGAVVGRYANRIAGGLFELDGREVVLATNDRGNTLHGGPDGFDRRTWTVLEHGTHHLVLELVSPDGDQGFPGTLTTTARYEVAGDEVGLVLTSRTDAPTVVNLTSHVYLRLPDPELTVPATTWLPVDATGLPLGDPVPVDGTPFDLRAGRRVAEVVNADHPQVRQAGGLDHTLVVPGEGLRTMAVLRSSVASVEVVSDQPGVQVFTGNGFDGTDRTWTGEPVERHGAVALEPQHFPDSPHHASYPTTVLRPGEERRTEVRWRVSR